MHFSFAIDQFHAVRAAFQHNAAEVLTRPQGCGGAQMIRDVAPLRNDELDFAALIGDGIEPEIEGLGVPIRANGSLNAHTVARRRPQYGIANSFCRARRLLQPAGLPNGDAHKFFAFLARHARLGVIGCEHNSLGRH